MYVLASSRVMIVFLYLNSGLYRDLMNQTVQLIISSTIFMHCACVLCVSPRSRPLSFNQETRVSSTLETILISRQQRDFRGVFSTGAMGPLAQAILKNRQLLDIF